MLPGGETHLHIAFSIQAGQTPWLRNGTASNATANAIALAICRLDEIAITRNRR